MRIAAKDRIAGFPATAIRALLRKAREGFDRRVVGSVLGIEMAAGERVVSDLQRLGYVMASPHGDAYFQNTVQGNALANASAAKPISRATADGLLKEVVKRARVANRRRFAYAVARLWAFGSYLSDLPLLSDIDLIVELTPRHVDPAKQWDFGQERVRVARRNGRRIDSLGAEVMWPENEVLLFLKSRSGYISLHRLEDSVAAAADQRLIFEDSRFMGLPSQPGGPTSGCS